MTDQIPLSRHVAYAERYARGPYSRFNAFSALERARLLMRETIKIEELFEVEAEKEEPANWLRHGFEIVPYTLVGLATCLEWHARSRLTDLYTFKPDSINRQALEGKVHPKVLSEMIRAKVSIPQLLGASITVGSFVEYISVFTSLFEIIGIKSKPENLIQPKIVSIQGLFGEEIRQLRVRDKIEQMFNTRHVLVHEVGYESDAGRTICDMWGPSEVLSMCHTVVSIITALELALTKHAPSDFPNLLTEYGYPVDIGDRLLRSIEELEKQISTEIARRPKDTQAAWREALAAAHHSLDAHTQLFSSKRLFEERYWIRTNPLRRTYLEQRYALLTEIAAALIQSGTPRIS